jgi:outer membrane protein OmpA-like peptidoglycan-associated protein
MTTPSTFRVPGEELGWSVPSLLLIFGVACSIGLGSLVGAAFRTNPERAEDRRPQTKRSVTVPPAAAMVVPGAASSNRQRADGAVAPSTLTVTASNAAERVACPAFTVLFPLGSVEPPESAKVKLELLAKWMTSHGFATVVVDGHADATGAEEVNLILSRNRAKSVARLLERSGVGRARMTVRGFGRYQPLEGAPEDASANRRVVLSFRGGSACPNLEESRVP